MATRSSPEAAFVLLLMQSIIWFITGVSAAPFVLGGEVHMAALTVATLLLALGTLLCGIGVLWRRRAARGAAIGLEVVCLAGAALMFWLPIGFNHGLVSIQPVDSDDDLINDLIKHNPAFRALLEKSLASPRVPFPVDHLGEQPNSGQ